MNSQLKLKSRQAGAFTGVNLKKASPPVLAFPLKPNLKSVKPPAGHERKTVVSWYLRIIVYLSENRIEVYRNKICLIVYDPVQRGVTYFDKSYNVTLLHAALVAAEKFSNSRSGEFSYSTKVIYDAPKLSCASQNAAYTSDLDALDVIEYAANSEDDVRANKEFIAARGAKLVKTREPSKNDGAIKKREYKQRLKAGLVTPNLKLSAIKKAQAAAKRQSQCDK